MQCFSMSAKSKYLMYHAKESNEEDAHKLFWRIEGEKDLIFLVAETGNIFKFIKNSLQICVTEL